MLQVGGKSTNKPNNYIGIQTFRKLLFWRICKCECFILAIYQLEAAYGTLKSLDERCWKYKNPYGKNGIMRNPSREVRWKDLILECLCDLLMCACLRIAGLHKGSSCNKNVE